ncbi:MAG: TIGR02099 family protein [Pseudomonadota bacterium]|nr:TIGR02099 family protein [Pseudomonadota bacterium]
MTWVLLVVALCLSVLLLSLRYWLLPGIEQYRENIASAISHTSGQHVTIGEISANWDGFRPHMMLHTIKVHDKETNITLLLDRLEGTLSWLSLLHGELRFREIKIDQPDLIVRRDSAGVIHVAGFALNGELHRSENGFFDWLLSQRQVIINNASILWQDDQRGAPELEFLVNLRLENRENRHRFGIRATPPAELAAKLDIRGDLTGESLDRLEQWRGQIFAQVDDGDIASWQAWLPFPQDIQFHRGSGALRLWLSIDRAEMKSLTADLRLHNVKTQLGQDLPELNLIRLHGRAGWQTIHDDTKAGVELFAHRLSASVRGKQELQPINFLLQMIPGKGKSSSGKLSVDNLHLEVLEDLAPYLPISEALREQFNKLSPRGEIHHMRATWNGEWPKPASFNAKGGFANLSIRKNDGLPAFSGITGNIDITERGGTLDLNSQRVSLELPDVFPEPLTVDTFTGQASWNFLAGDSIALKFNNISFSNTHAAGFAYGSYHAMPSGPGVIDLVAQLKRADVRYLKRYIPIKANPYVHDWLDKSIVKGELTDARLHLKGDLAEFPFVRTDSGVFRLQAKASGVTLNHISGWPHIEDISGHLQFHGSSMKFDASQASISGTRLSKATFHIADMTAPDAMLESQGEIIGQTAEFLKLAVKYTGNTPNNRLVDDISITGSGKLVFKMDIPFRDSGDIKLAGSYQFIDNQINPGTRIPNLDKINGTLAFTDSGITIENVAAQFLGGPVVINSTAMAGGNTRVSAIGKVNLDNLPEPAEQRVSGAAQLWRRHLRGSTDWKAVIDVHGKLMDVAVESSLQGITSELPEPFSKAATEVAPLRFERKATGSDNDVLKLSYGGMVAAKIKRLQDNKGVYHAERGIVNFGIAPGVLPEKAGIRVNGTLPRVDLDQWRSLLSQSNDKSGPSLNLTYIDLHIGALDFLGKRLNEITLNASKEDELWHSIVISREIKGDVNWELAGNGKVVARLKTLVMPTASPHNPNSAMQTQQQEKSLPALDLTADSFIVGEKQLGRLELIASPQEQNWRIEKLHITGSDSSLIAKGIWQSHATPPRIQASIKLEASNIGEFLRHLGYPNRVKRGSGKLEGVLSWYGSLQSVDYPTLSGSFKVKAGRGQFPKFEPGIGRLFGMFDLRALPRRITLDFRDVFSEGFGFDDISGEVKIIHGVAITDDFRIEGPAAKVFMKGELNLEAETQKLHVTVTPSLGLATPVVGIVSKALQNPTRSDEYNVTGTWADPTIIKRPRHAQEPGEHE